MNTPALDVAGSPLCANGLDHLATALLEVRIPGIPAATVGTCAECLVPLRICYEDMGGGVVAAGAVAMTRSSSLDSHTERDGAGNHASDGVLEGTAPRVAFEPRATGVTCPAISHAYAVPCYVEVEHRLHFARLEDGSNVSWRALIDRPRVVTA